tara:strand:+ start:1043 stop:1246 length:204 start_codon:yes stop_codon:yes gene_type:complete
MHDEGWLSGCLYINVTPKESPMSGNLVICLDNDSSSGNSEEIQKNYPRWNWRYVSLSSIAAELHNTV